MNKSNASLQFIFNKKNNSLYILNSYDKLHKIYSRFLKYSKYSSDKFTNNTVKMN